jgi:hypothetical protein
MPNIEITEQAIRNLPYFKNDFVSENSLPYSVKINTGKSIIRHYELESLKTQIESLGGNIDDIYIATSPLHHRMYIVITFCQV